MVKVLFYSHFIWGLILKLSSSVQIVRNKHLIIFLGTLCLCYYFQLLLLFTKYLKVEINEVLWLESQFCMVCLGILSF